MFKNFWQQFWLNYRSVKSELKQDVHASDFVIFILMSSFWLYVTSLFLFDKAIVEWFIAKQAGLHENSHAFSGYIWE